jgi:hypothetical protein
LIVFAALVLLGAGGYGLYRLWPGAGRGFGPGPDIGPGPDGL